MMKKENLMFKFPYNSGDVLDDGTKISVVIQGDANDTFGGYLCREVIKTVDDIPEYGKDVICESLDEAKTPGRHAYPLQVVGPVPFGYPKVIGSDGYPKGAKIWFRVPGEKKDRCCAPAEFLCRKSTPLVDLSAIKTSDVDIVDILKTKDGSENAKETAEPQNDETSVAMCQATTKAKNPCKGKAVNGGKFCMSHAK